MMLLGNFRFVPSSQTFNPMGNGVNCGCSLIQDSCTLCWASWATFLASLMDKSCSSGEGMVVFLVGWCTWGVYPMSKLYRVFLVVADGHEFLVYWASRSHVCQLFCCVPQNIQRYCSKV